MRFGVICDQKWQVVRTVHNGTVTIHSCGQTISSFPQIEGIPLGVGKEIYETVGKGKYTGIRIG